MPGLEETDRAGIEGDIQLTEIEQAIRKVKTGNSPGPDGFLIEFYRSFSIKLLPYLCKVYTEAFKVKALPPTMTQATISVLLKKDKDPPKCEFYRSVSLLCCDYKILTRILADRLERVLDKIIHQDQTGFMRGRQLYSNLRRAFNIMYLPNGDIVPEVIISLDAHKAFDRIEHSYLMKALEYFEFGPSFCAWIEILYGSPQAAVRTNNIVSEYFRLFRGTRQGCPLSQLLFNVAIEPLASALRNDPGVMGINRAGQMHTVTLYADYLLLFLFDP